MLSKKMARRAIIGGTIFVGLGMVDLIQSFVPLLLGENVWQAIQDIIVVAIGVLLMNAGLSPLTGGDGE